jgi:tryptophan 2,3-dioxygenase
MQPAHTCHCVSSLDKADYLLWSRKYDKAFGWQAQRERELSFKFRKNKVMTKADLAAVVEWKFKNEPDKKTRVQQLIERNSDEAVERVSSQAFNLPAGDDLYRMNCLMTLDGVNPVLASVVLTFFDPKVYGIFDARVWKPLLGNPPGNLLTVMNYCKLLLSLRKTAGKHNLDVRVIDKALYKKSLESS